MELRPLCVMILIILLIPDGKADAKPKPTVSVNPQSFVYTGDTVTVTCNLESHGWTFSWYRTINSGSQTRSTENTKTLHDTVSTAGETEYQCIAHRINYDSDWSDPVKITVKARPKPVVSIEPDDRVHRGETATLRCEIQDGQDFHWSFSWNKDGVAVSNEQKYSISGVESSHAGKYTCSGGEAGGSRASHPSDAVTLTVSDPAEAVVSVSPLNWLTEGDSVTLSCEVKHSSTGWTFSWYRDVLHRTRAGFLGDTTALLSDSSRGSGGSYTLSPVTLKHSGLYVCRAERGEPAFHTQYSKPHPLWITGESPPVSLIISPSRTQHFTVHSLSLSCGDQRDSPGWTVRGWTHTETQFDCSSFSGPGCDISPLSTSHTGVYWCESESGGRSNPVNITVHDGHVILDSPVHPVPEGDPLTLRCLYRNTKISPGSVFFKNDSLLQTSQTSGEMIVLSVSKSDEGFYHCKHPEGRESLKSWVSVTAPSSVLQLLSSVAAACPYVLVTVILAVKCYRA